MFQGLSTALTALYADRQALETTGNNIANVNTKGYARQRVDQANINASANSFWSTGTNAVGQGTTITGITRITDEFLKAQALTAHGTSGQLNATNTALQNIQTGFNEPSDEGLQHQLSEFWGTFDDLAKDTAGNPALRVAVVEQTQTLVSNIQQIDSSLNLQSEQAKATLKGDISQINAYASKIADLNKAIKSQTQSGQTPNGLLDQRDQAVSELSNLVGVSVKAGEFNSISIVVGGVALVRDSSTNTLQVDDSGTPVVLRWDDDGNAGTSTDGQIANLTGGSAGGQLDVLNNIVPKYKVC